MGPSPPADDNENKTFFMFFVSLSHDVNEYILHAHGLPLTRDLIYKFNYARSPVGLGGVVSCSFSRLTDLAG